MKPGVYAQREVRRARYAVAAVFAVLGAQLFVGLPAAFADEPRRGGRGHARGLGDGGSLLPRDGRPGPVMRTALLSLALLASSCAGTCSAMGGGSMAAGAIGGGSIGPGAALSGPVVIDSGDACGSPPGTPSLHYAARLETEYANTDPVPTATDQGSLGVNAAQATGSAQPTFVADCINGLPCYSFDGGDSLFTGEAAFSMPNPNREGQAYLDDFESADEVPLGLRRQDWKLSSAPQTTQGDDGMLPFVLDATTGQNGMIQAKVFSEVVDVTGIVLTKLDGSAKGGIVVAVQRQLGVPVKLVGLGEGPDDLAPFDAAAFVDALIG